MTGKFGPHTHPIAWRHHQAEMVARSFHEVYETRAPEFAYETRPESAKPWEDVPNNNKDLMVAVVQDLLEAGVIEVGKNLKGGLHGH